jgi:hypothetical protein
MEALMKKDTTYIPTQNQLKSPKQLEENKRQPWQRPLLQRLNLSLDTAFGNRTNVDGMIAS